MPDDRAGERFAVPLQVRKRAIRRDAVRERRLLVSNPGADPTQAAPAQLSVFVFVVTAEHLPSYQRDGRSRGLED